MDSTTGDQGSFVPFTKAERIQQLGEIDESIVSLLRTVGKVVQGLGPSGAPDQDGDTAVNGNGQGDADAFKGSVDDFFRTLHSVNVRIKRQIWGLEEAGIITLAKDDDEDEASKAKGKKTLEPDGHGRIGGLDAGWLNSRSNKVEMDMESELWDQAELFLKQVLEKGSANNNTDSMEH